MISPFCLVLKCGFNHSKITVFNYLFCAWWWYFFVCLRSKKNISSIAYSRVCWTWYIGGVFCSFCFTVILLSCSKFHSTEYNNEDFNCLKYFILGYFFLCRRCSKNMCICNLTWYMCMSEKRWEIIQNSSVLRFMSLA